MSEKMSDYELRSKAGVLFCLDYLMHHLSDEESQIPWMTSGIPDDVWLNSQRLNDQQTSPYVDFVEKKDESEAGFEEYVKLAVGMLYDECFGRKYIKGGLA